MKADLFRPGGNCTGWLDDSPAAQSVIVTLALEARANTQGNEIYLMIPISAKTHADARALVRCNP